MEMLFPFFLFGGFLVLVIVMAVFSHRAEKERQEKLRQFAVARQWYFEPEKVRGFDAKYLQFDFLDRGVNRYAHNILAGKLDEFEIEAFDYHYETHSTDSDGKRKTQHHRFCVAVLTAPFPLKELCIRPEGIFDKLSAAFGWDDIDFESAEFSREFHVKAPDRRWAFDVLHPRSIAYLLECPRHEIHFSRNQVAVKGRSRFEPWEFSKSLEMGETLLRGIPDFARGSE